MSKVTVREASILTGKSRETINNATKDGTISYTQNSRGIKVIDIVELERVYPITNSIEDLKKPKPVNTNQNLTESDSDEWKERYIELKNKLDMTDQEKNLVKEERQRERVQFENQIDNLQGSLKLSQETAQKVTMLLEDKSKDSGAGEWEKSLKALENRLANQEKVSKETAEKEQKIIRQNRALKRALDEERNKSFFKKLFG